MTIARARGDPLLLAAGELRRGAVGQAGRPSWEREIDVLSDVGRLHLLQLQTERDIVAYCQVREQSVGLEDHADRAPFGASPMMSAPLSWIMPVVGVSNPAIMRRIVVLPQPDGPSNAMNSPGVTDSSTLLTAAAHPPRRYIVC